MKKAMKMAMKKAIWIPDQIINRLYTGGVTMPLIRFVKTTMLDTLYEQIEISLCCATCGEDLRGNVDVTPECQTHFGTTTGISHHVVHRNVRVFPCDACTNGRMKNHETTIKTTP
jgi:hypothetical protein